MGIGVRVSSTGDGGEVLSGKAKRSDRSTQKKDFVIRFNEELAGGRSGAQKTKWARDDGGGKVNRFDQRRGLVKAVNPKDELGL